MLASYSLHNTVQFPVRIQGNSHTLIDNIFINTFKHDEFSLYPVLNGLSDHDAQIIIISTIPIHDSRNLFHYSRKIDKYSVNNFKLQFNYELWEEIFTTDNVNINFNNFLNTYLRLFYACFPIKKFNHKHYAKAWITPAIKLHV